MHAATAQTTTTHVAGRSCPLSYRYRPADFDRPPELRTQTLYLVGGLYGNPFALDAIEAQFAAEPGVAGHTKHMVFNGDFHWFDIDAQLFARLDKRVGAYEALRGNVETEIAQSDAGADCGCAYPDDVDNGTVERSNVIITRLRQAAQQDPACCARLAALPMHLRAQVGDARIGIVHGDAESLAGWRFDAAALDDRAVLPWLAQVFAHAKVDVFASSHTCAAALRTFNGMGTVVNNGAAGMSSVPGTPHGMFTRVALTAAHGPAVLASARVAGVYVQAIAVQFDIAAWQQQFLAMWPEGSAAHTSYWRRIVHGPLTNTLHAPVDYRSCAQ